MVAIIPKAKTLTDYLENQPDDGVVYELENGEWLKMPPESDLNRRIATFLLVYFAQLGIPPRLLSQKTEVAVVSAKVSLRVPDLIVLSEEAALALENATRSTIMQDMPPPELVVEVVSPGTENINRDYRYKRAQYQAQGINEYWIVDPLSNKVIVLVMNEGLYDETIFTGLDVISSPLLQRYSSDEPLTVEQVFQKS